MIDGDILKPYGVAHACRENVHFIDARRVIEISEVVTTAQLVPSARVIDLRHELVLRLLHGVAREGHLAGRAVRKRDIVQKITGDGVQAACGNDVSRNRLARYRIYQLTGN